jgi:hypothetical protein
MRLLREPLVQFLLLGSALFALSTFVGHGSGAGGGTVSDKQIIVTPQQVALLKSGFVLDNGREPTDADLQRLIDAYVREEVLVREARAQGLDRDDSIVRRRLVQKMEFAVPEPAAPADSVLEEYLSRHPAAFASAGRKTPALSQIHGAVLAAWMNDQRRKELDEIYQRYRAEYQVTLQQPPSNTNPTAGGTP